MRNYFYIFIFTVIPWTIYTMQEPSSQKGVTAAPLMRITACFISKNYDNEYIKAHFLELPEEHQEQVIFFKKRNNDLDRALIDSTCLVGTLKQSNAIPLPSELLAMGADPNCKISDEIIENEPLLHFAITINKQIVFEELLLHPKIDIESRCPRGYTALMIAAQKAGISKSYVEKLLEYNAKVDTYDNNGYSPLMSLCETSFSLAIAQHFLNSINVASKRGITALHRATSAGEKEWVVWLLQNGVDVNAKDNRNLTPLSWARSVKNQEIIKLLTDAGAVE